MAKAEAAIRRAKELVADIRRLVSENGELVGKGEHIQIMNQMQAMTLCEGPSEDGVADNGKKLASAAAAEEMVVIRF